MKSIPPSGVRAWVRSELFDSGRTRPIVAITTHRTLERTFVDPGHLEQQLGQLAVLVTFETGDATWELAEALPDRLDVYGGAMRVWWPGLTAESDPHDHKLYLIHSEDEGRARVAQLRGQLLRKAGPDLSSKIATETAIEAPTAVELERVTVTVSVLSVEDGVLLQEPDGSIGRLVSADVPVEALEVCLREGMELSVTRPKSHDWSYGEAPCSAEGLLPTPWERVGAELNVGDVVQGRVAHIVDEQNYALIELLPNTAGIVFRPDIDHTFVKAIEDFVRIDELVQVKILELDAVSQRARLSVKAVQASHAEPRPLPTLVPGGVPFEWAAYLGRTGVGFTTTQDPREQRIEELEGELEAANEDRSSLRQTVTSLRQDLRSLQGRYQDLERRTTGEVDPLSDERAFLRAVRVWYAREIGEGERHDHPLQTMRVGRQFLDSARSLDGVSADKIVEVAGQVACGRAREFEGRDVHALGVAGPATATKQRARARDGAKAWRCALQVNTASARRLHWWLIPGPNGGTIEFASVAVHDVFDIPE